ncbi:MAG: hypothetical protein ACYTHJ_13810 [Planctomycetota bacterium]
MANDHGMSWWCGHGRRVACMVVMMATIFIVAGCSAPQPDAGARQGGATSSQDQSQDQVPDRSQWPKAVVAVRCLYDSRPFFSYDGDTLPDSIRYRVFLDTGDNVGIMRSGKFHIELYKLERYRDGTVKRKLICEWDRLSSEMNTIAKPGLLGEGFVFQLWTGTNDISGKEIEISTVFEDEYGRKARSVTRHVASPISTAPIRTARVSTPAMTISRLPQTTRSQHRSWTASRIGRISFLIPPSFPPPGAGC